MKLIHFLLVILAMVFAVSTANAQSHISAISEWEGNAMGAYERNWNALLELEYEADEGGMLLNTYDYVSIKSCNYTCTVEITFLPGQFQFWDTQFPGSVNERDRYYGTGLAYYQLIYDSPCDDENEEHPFNATVWVYDYQNNDFDDRMYYYPDDERCTFNGFVQLNVQP